MFVLTNKDIIVKEKQAEIKWNPLGYNSAQVKTRLIPMAQDYTHFKQGSY